MNKSMYLGQAILAAGLFAAPQVVLAQTKLTPGLCQPLTESNLAACCAASNWQELVRPGEVAYCPRLDDDDDNSGRLGQALGTATTTTGTAPTGTATTGTAPTGTATTGTAPTGATSGAAGDSGTTVTSKGGNPGNENLNPATGVEPGKAGEKEAGTFQNTEPNDGLAQGGNDGGAFGEDRGASDIGAGGKN